MQIATWLSVLILGPGSIAVLLWFLLDVKRIFGGARTREHVEPRIEGGVD